MSPSLKSILKNLFWIIVGIVLALLLQRPIEQYLDAGMARREEPNRILEEAENDRGRFTESGVRAAIEKYEQVIQKAPQFRVRAYLGLSRSYADLAANRIRRGLSRGDAPERALNYALQAVKLAPHEPATGVALAYSFEAHEAELPTKIATKSKVHELLPHSRNDVEMQYLAWIVRVDDSAESFPDTLNLRTTTYQRALFDVGMYFADQAESATVDKKEDYVQRAGECCDRAGQLNPDNPILYFCRGYIAALRGDLAGARDFYSRALALEVDFPMARNNLGYVLAAEGDYQAARAQFESAVLTPGAPVLNKATWLHNLGATHLELRQKEKACEAWRQAFELPVADRSFLSHWGLAMCNYLEGRTIEAKKQYHRAVPLALKFGFDLKKLSTFRSWKAGPEELRIAKAMGASGT